MVSFSACSSRLPFACFGSRRIPRITCFPGYWNPRLTADQAHRIITQIVVTGSRVLSRAFTEAYKQAQASSNYARAQAKLNPNAPGARGGSGSMTLDEACKILNVKPPQGVNTNVEEVMERFKKLFDANDPQKGGSFYLQSKILRARERIEAEIRPVMEKAAQEAEIKEGFKPKVYKDR
ncbi:import inner membrane translocase subunit TIM16 [Xylaria scruposa]|nr:import inner membrane translocase subunit TIM16 [Xylaria scruposa]